MADHAQADRRAAPADAGQPAGARAPLERPALGETARQLNSAPAVVAQRALAARLSGPVQRAEAPAAPNRTGLPDTLKAGIETLSGVAMDDVRVHRNSAAPAQLGAHAYAQGSDIHLAPGQEQHLPHEAWHVVQQKQGRVRATMQMKAGVPVNDDSELEREADAMGVKALSVPAGHANAARALAGASPAQRRVAQRKLSFLGGPIDPQSEPNDPVTTKLAELRDSEKTYYIRDDWKGSYTGSIHVLEGSKKYLLGETHHSGEWEKETGHWTHIAKMSEGGHMMPEDVSTHGANNGVLPLESIHAFLMGAITMLHNLLNGHAQLGEQTPPEGMYESVLFYLREIGKAYPTYDTYVKKLKKPKDGDFDAQTKRIIAFHTDFHSTYLPAVKRMIVDIKAVIAKKPVPGWKARLAEDRKILPVMGRKLGPVTGVAQDSEIGQGLRDVLKSDTMMGDEASFALREEAMAKNVRAGPAPLLVQIGDLHVVSVAGKVGTSSVAVKESVGLAKKTLVKLS